MPSFSSVFPSVQAHYLALQIYMETSPDDKQKAEACRQACLASAKKLVSLFQKDMTVEIPPQCFVDVITMVTKLALYQSYSQPGIPFEKVFETQLHQQANAMGVDERLVFRYASGLTDRSDPLKKTLSESFGVLAETIFKAIKCLFTLPFNRDAYQNYKEFLRDAWGFNHQAALCELSEIFNEPRQSNITFPSEGKPQRPPTDPLSKGAQRTLLQDEPKKTKTAAPPSPSSHQPE